ncbi:MAG: hypothetical protein DI595_07795 [Agrobacterium fabrum]|uniref:DUF6985 domain-containing protein n=1 Tax=Agrobacterium fabrum TaxID=1176649 RepID=A0A2W5F7E9_9HYPH|nr:MAG: hypothetical protein DI595_07795 [Agrobacterium fabrum]
MLLDKIAPGKTVFEAEGLPPLYGGDGYWQTALPMPLTSTLWHSLVALPHPRRGYPDFAEPGEVSVALENDDGSGDSPNSVMLDTARWLIANDEEVERTIIKTILADLPTLQHIESQVMGKQVLPELWDEPTIRQLIRLLYIVIHDVRGQLPYFGVEFACTWEDEHGYGIMFHGTEVLKTGGGDIPNLSWVAARHAKNDA